MLQVLCFTAQSKCLAKTLKRFELYTLRCLELARDTMLRVGFLYNHTMHESLKNAEFKKLNRIILAGRDLQESLSAITFMLEEMDPKEEEIYTLTELRRLRVMRQQLLLLTPDLLTPNGAVNETLFHMTILTFACYQKKQRCIRS